MDEALFWIVFVAIFAGVLYTHFRPGLVGGGSVRDVKEYGWFGEICLDVVEDAAGHRHVSLFFSVTSETDARLVVTPAQARKLARMLRLAAAPGKNLAQARWNLRKAQPQHPELEL